VFKVVDRFVPSTPRSVSPMQRGAKSSIEALFSGTAQSNRLTRRDFVFRYRSPSHWLSVFRTFYGPTCQVFAVLDASGQARLTRDPLALLDRYNRSGDRTLVLPRDFVEDVVNRRVERAVGRRGRQLRAIDRVSDGGHVV